MKAHSKQFQEVISETDPHMLGCDVTDRLDWINSEIKNTAHASKVTEDAPNETKLAKLWIVESNQE